MMDLTGLYPIAAAHPALEGFGGRFSCPTTDRFRFSMYSQSLGIR